jgi:hypothetical protein
MNITDLIAKTRKEIDELSSRAGHSSESAAGVLGASRVLLQSFLRELLAAYHMRLVNERVTFNVDGNRKTGRCLKLVQAPDGITLAIVAIAAEVFAVPVDELFFAEAAP